MHTVSHCQWEKWKPTCGGETEAAYHMIPWGSCTWGWAMQQPHEGPASLLLASGPQWCCSASMVPSQPHHREPPSSHTALTVRSAATRNLARAINKTDRLSKGQNTGIPHFIVLCFIALCRHFGFFLQTEGLWQTCRSIFPAASARFESVTL